MKKFLKVELGSRGEVENVEFVSTTYELIQDEYDDKYDDLSIDNDDVPYLEEFSSIEMNEEKGVVVYGFTEEDSTFYVECDKHEDFCSVFMYGWENESEDFENGIEYLFKLVN
jgi:hypothetical protein